MRHDTVDATALDQKTHALLRLAASLAIDAAPSSDQSIVDGRRRWAPPST